MALPKRRHSRARGRKRRTHYKLDRAARTACSHCHAPKLPHRVCSNCGYYHGRQVVSMEKS